VKDFRVYIYIIISITIGILVSLIDKDVFLWILLLIGLLSPLIIVIKEMRKSDVFLNPAFWFFSCMCLWSITFLFDYFLGFEENYSYNHVLNTALLYSIANFTSVTFFCVFVKFLKKKNNFNDSNEIFFGEKKSAVPGLILVFIGFLMLLYKIKSIGGVEALGIQNRINITHSSETQSTLNFPWHAPLNVGLVYIASVIRSKKLYRLLSFIIAISIFLILGFGARGDVLFVCLPSILVILYRKNFFCKKTNRILLILIVLLFLSPIFTISRNIIIYNKNIGDFEKWEWAYNRGETGGAFRVTLDVVNSHYIVNWPDYIYLKEFFSFLPSAIYQGIFKEEKFSSDKFFVSQFYEYRAKNGMSFGFSPVAEAWIVGGIKSIIIVFSLAGIIISLAYKYKFPIALIPTLIWFHRVSFDTFISSVIFILFFHLLLYIFDNLVHNKKKFNVKENAFESKEVFLN